MLGNASGEQVPERIRRKVLYLQYTNPAGYPPLEHSSRILAREGWQVLFLGTGALGGADALRFPPHDRIDVRRMEFSPAGWRQKLHYVRFCLWVLFWTFRWRPQWIYASDPLSCPNAAVLSFFSRFKVLYHEHDSPQPEVREKRSEVSCQFMRLVLWTRRQLARRASLCVLPNEQRAERFAFETGRSTADGLSSPLIVWNCPSLDEVSKPRGAHDGGDLWVLYHGSIVPSRLPVAVLKALAILPLTVKLRVIGYETVGHRGYVQELRKSAIQFGITHRVEFLGAMPRKDLLKWCQECDIGLAFLTQTSDDVNQQAMIGASNKPFDYLACGLALLVSDLPDWCSMYVDSGYGLACDSTDAEGIATALGWFLDHPTEMRAMGERGRKKIMAEWNYERKFKPVFEHIARDVQ